MATYTPEQILAYTQGMTPDQMAQAAIQFGVPIADVAQAYNVPVEQAVGLLSQPVQQQVYDSGLANPTVPTSVSNDWIQQQLDRELAASQASGSVVTNAGNASQYQDYYNNIIKKGLDPTKIGGAKGVDYAGQTGFALPNGQYQIRSELVEYIKDPSKVRYSPDVGYYTDQGNIDFPKDRGALAEKIAMGAVMAGAGALIGPSLLADLGAGWGSGAAVGSTGGTAVYDAGAGMYIDAATGAGIGSAADVAAAGMTIAPGSAAIESASLGLGGSGGAGYVPTGGLTGAAPVANPPASSFGPAAPAGTAVAGGTSIVPAAGSSFIPGVSNSILAPIAGAALAGMGGSSQAGTTKTEQVPWEAQQPYLLDLFKRSQTALNSAGKMNPAEESGYQMLGQQSLLGNPAVNAGQDMLTRTLSGEYLDPTKNPAWQPTVNRMTDAYKLGTAAQTDAAAARAGAYGIGNSAYEQRLQQNQRSFGDSLTNLAGNLYNTERGNQMSAANLAPTYQTAANQNAQNLINYGQQYRYDPFTTLGKYQGLVGNNYGSTTTQPYFDNKASSLLGGALVGSQIYKGLLGA